MASPKVTDIRRYLMAFSIRWARIRLRSAATAAECKVPVWHDPVFMAKMGQLVSALAKRYNGNPNIEFFKESFGASPVPVLRCFHVAGWWRRLRKGPAWD